MIDIEQWRPIPDWEGFYEISSWGKVRSLPRVVNFPDGRRSYTRPARLLGWRSRGYVRVVLVAPGKPKREAFLHDLVLETFVGPRPPGLICCHSDDDGLNNHISNLRWGTYSDNGHDCVRNGKHHSANKTHCKRGHPFDEQNTGWRLGGGRFCRECMRIHSREHARRKHGHKPRIYRSDMTECRQGHPITEANTYTNPKGEQSCRICRAESMRRHKERKRLEGAR